MYSAKTVIGLTEGKIGVPFQLPLQIVRQTFIWGAVATQPASVTDNSMKLFHNSIDKNGWGSFSMYMFPCSLEKKSLSPWVSQAYFSDWQSISKSSYSGVFASGSGTRKVSWKLFKQTSVKLPPEARLNYWAIPHLSKCSLEETRSFLVPF